MPLEARGAVYSPLLRAGPRAGSCPSALAECRRVAHGRADGGGFGCATCVGETTQDRLDLPATLRGVPHAAVSGAGLCGAWQEAPALSCWDITGEWWDPGLVHGERGESEAWSGLPSLP